MFLALSKLLDVALAPLTWAIGLYAASFALSPRRPAATWCAALGTAVLVVFSCDAVADRIMAATESSAPRTFRPGVTYEAAILLTGMLDAGATARTGEPELNAATDRLLRTFELLRAGSARAVLISGGAVFPGEPNEAQALAALLERWGIAPDRIVVEAGSRNTHENAVESARVVAARGWSRLLLVTSAAHMPRALGCFRAQGLTPDALPVDVRGGSGRRWFPRAEALEQSTAALHELAGRLVYRAVGYSR